MRDSERGPARTFLAIALVLSGLMVGAGAVVVIDAGEGTRTTTTTQAAPPPAVPVNVAVDGPDVDVKPDTPITLDAKAREIVQDAQEAPERFDISGNLRGEDNTPVAQQEGPLATPNFPGCTTRILPTNWSERGGKTVKTIDVHYTAGGNLPGLSDMNGLTGFASSPSARVSWHFLIDAEGHCYYSVPLSKKAWTIGNLNRESVNIEVIGRGNEPRYPASAAGALKLRSVVRQLGRIYNIPMRLAAYRDCTVTRSGIGTHWMGGVCSGGHIDIKPYDISKVIAAIAAGSEAAKNDPRSYRLSLLTPSERRNATCLLGERRVAARHGGWGKVDGSHIARARGCKRVLDARNVELHRLGVTSTAARARRHGVIHEVL